MPNEKKIAEKFDKSCETLLEKMREFEDNYFCSKCGTDICIHLRRDMNKKFEKEIEENSRLVIALAHSTFEKALEDCAPKLAC